MFLHSASKKIKNLFMKPELTINRNILVLQGLWQLLKNLHSLPSVSVTDFR